MVDRGYGLCDGAVYKKIPESTYTYVHCSSVKNFLLKMLGSTEIADVIATLIVPITNLLSEPSCRLIKPTASTTTLLKCWKAIVLI